MPPKDIYRFPYPAHARGTYRMSLQTPWRTWPSWALRIMSVALVPFGLLIAPIIGVFVSWQLMARDVIDMWRAANEPVWTGYPGEDITHEPL